MLQFAGPAHGDYSAIGGGMGFGKVKVNGHEVTTYTHTQTHKHTPTYISMIRTYIRMYIRIYMHTYILQHTYIHIHVEHICMYIYI
jgi:hypothetical protein